MERTLSAPPIMGHVSRDGSDASSDLTESDGPSVEDEENMEDVEDMEDEEDEESEEDKEDDTKDPNEPSDGNELAESDAPDELSESDTSSELSDDRMIETTPAMKADGSNWEKKAAERWPKMKHLLDKERIEGDE